MYSHCSKDKQLLLQTTAGSVSVDINLSHTVGSHALHQPSLDS